MKIDYNNLYTHFIFITLNRLPVIQEKNRNRIEKYITGIINNNDSKLYSIYAIPEHVHFIISRSPKLSEEYLSSIIADSSERFINGKKLCIGHFSWQKTAAAFFVSANASLWEKADVNKVCKYILNQPRHHHKITFNEEYESFMKFYQKTLNAFK